MVGKRIHRFTDDDDSRSTDGMSSEEATSSRRRRSRTRRNTSRTNELTYSQGKAILRMIAEVKEEIRKQSKQFRDDTSEMRRQLEKLTESHNDIRKQLELHTNRTSGDSAASRSQRNQVQLPRYRLVFTSGDIDKIGKGQTIEISVALIDGSNDRTVENGPLASATVELVVVNAEFNQHDNQYNWSREDFESNIKKARQGNSATGDVDQSVKSIVSNGRFNLVRGVKCHSGSTIFSNSSNKKVRLGVMVVSPTKERVLEGLSNPFFVRGHDRPPRQSNLRHNKPKRQMQDLVDDGYQAQDGPLPNLQNTSWPHSTQPGGITLNITGGQPQLPFLGNTAIFSTEPSISYEQHALMHQYQVPHRSMLAGQARNNQNDELSPALFSYARDPNSVSNDHGPVHAIGRQFNTNQIAFPVHILWDRHNVEPSKPRWNFLNHLMPVYTCQQKFNICGLPTMRLMPEHYGSLTITPKEVMQTRRRRGVLIEPLPDDSYQERLLKRKLRGKYRLRFVNKVRTSYYTMDPIKADDGSFLKVALFDENNMKITFGPLSSASVEVVVLDGDLNVVNGQGYWTLEEFRRCIVRPRSGEKVLSVLGGDHMLVLANGEACVSDAFFQIPSVVCRNGNFRMGVVMLSSAKKERVQEGVTESFVVKDNRAKDMVAPMEETMKQQLQSVLAAEEPSGDEEKVHLAVSMNDGRKLQQALKLIKPQTKVVLVHIHQPSTMIPIPFMGGRVHASILQDDAVKEYREKQSGQALQVLKGYREMCTRAKFQAEILMTENDSVADGLLKLMVDHEITTLIILGIGKCWLNRSKRNLAAALQKGADPSCNILFMHRGRLNSISQQDGSDLFDTKGTPSISSCRPSLSSSNGSSPSLLWDSRSTPSSTFWYSRRQSTSDSLDESIDTKTERAPHLNLTEYSEERHQALFQSKNSSEVSSRYQPIGGIDLVVGANSENFGEIYWKAINGLPVAFELIIRVLNTVQQLLRHDICEGNGLTPDKLYKGFKAFKSMIKNFSPQKVVQDGSILPITGCVMKYIRLLINHAGSLDTIWGFGQNSDALFSKGSSDHLLLFDGVSFIGHLVCGLIGDLSNVIEEKSRLYASEGLRSIFLMNNANFIIQEVENSDMRLVVGAEWLKQRRDDLDMYVRNYMSSTWEQVTSYLTTAASPPHKRLRLGLLGFFHTNARPLQSFESSFNETCNSQMHWKVPCPVLRSKLRQNISEHVIQAYQACLETLKQSSIGIAGDLKSKISELFEG